VFSTNQETALGELLTPEESSLGGRDGSGGGIRSPGALGQHSRSWKAIQMLFSGGFD